MHDIVVYQFVIWKDALLVRVSAINMASNYCGPRRTNKHS